MPASARYWWSAATPRLIDPRPVALSGHRIATGEGYRVVMRGGSASCLPHPVLPLAERARHAPRSACRLPRPCAERCHRDGPAIGRHPAAAGQCAGRRAAGGTGTGSGAGRACARCSAARPAAAAAPAAPVRLPSEAPLPTPAPLQKDAGAPRRRVRLPRPPPRLPLLPRPPTGAPDPDPTQIAAAAGPGGRARRPRRSSGSIITSTASRP